jgi:hypothetical protein
MGHCRGKIDNGWPCGHRFTLRWWLHWQPMLTREKERIVIHPCSDHPCDHCYTCDVLGICCSTISSGLHALYETGGEIQRDRLHDAMNDETGPPPSLPEMICREAGYLPTSTRLGLGPAPAPAAWSVAGDAEKEAAYHVNRNRAK